MGKGEGMKRKESIWNELTKIKYSQTLISQNTKTFEISVKNLRYIKVKILKSWINWRKLMSQINLLTITCSTLYWGAWSLEGGRGWVGVSGHWKGAVGVPDMNWRTSCWDSLARRISNCRRTSSSVWAICLSRLFLHRKTWWLKADIILYYHGFITTLSINRVWAICLSRLFLHREGEHLVKEVWHHLTCIQSVL